VETAFSTTSGHYEYLVMPYGMMTGRLYILSAVRDRLIYWAHTSPSSGHPDIGRTVRCLSGKYLPVPQQPWSHLSVVFLTDPPPSQGNTTILVIVDRFSNSCRLLPLTGLPMALQTAEALFTHVFRHCGEPEDIVSDRGPQFTSRAWKMFMERLGVSVSLTSDFHPESNVQVERVNQDVGRFLRSNCQDRPGEWAAFMLWATPPLTLLPSSVYWGISQFWLLGIRVRPRLLRWTTGSGTRRKYNIYLGFWSLVCTY
jgi:hypothetical protein